MFYDDCLNKETITQTTYSPQVVLNEEVVTRVLFSPKHYDDGEIVAAAFDQILNQQGMSVLRISHDFENSLQRTITLLQKDDINKYFGHVAANVQDIRNIMKDDFRIFYVLDTATEDRIGHADVFSIRPNDKLDLPPKSLKKYIRKQIADIFNDLYIDTTKVS